MKRLARMIATVGGVGYLKPAPGTWGSLAALPMAWLLHEIGGVVLLMIAVVATFFKGLWATSVVTAGSLDHDPSEIVIDEVAGQWIALLPLSYFATTMSVPITTFWPGWIAAFLLFRLFDVSKPGPVGWADKRGDPLGVMLDDVWAGVLAAVGVLALAGLVHGVMGA